MNQGQRFKSKMLRKEDKLDVRIIDVNEWMGMNEVSKMHLLNTLLNTTASASSEAVENLARM